MNTEYFVLSLLVADDAAEWHVLEHVIYLLEHTVWVINVFSKSLGALSSKSEVSVHIAVLVASSKHKDLLWILELQCHQKANDFKTLAATVNVVAQEEVVIAANISSFAGGLPEVEEAHEITVISVNISKHLDGWL